MRLAHVILVIGFGTVEGDKGSREFHLRIWPAQADCLLDQAISVQTSGGIWFVFADPLLVGLDEIADVKPSKSVGMASGV